MLLQVQNFQHHDKWISRLYHCTDVVDYRHALMLLINGTFTSTSLGTYLRNSIVGPGDADDYLCL
jgi:hypothetical protein